MAASPISIVPPWRRTCCWTRASPKPDPSPWAPAPRTKRPKMRARSASGMPGPASATSRITASSPFLERQSSTRPRPWRTPFSTRLSINSRMPCGQASIGIGSPSSSSIRDSGCRRRAASTAASATSPTSTGSRSIIAPASARASDWSEPEQRRQPVLLLDRLGQDLRPLLRRQVGVAPQGLQVGPHRRERGPQLVAGVGREPPRGRQRRQCLAARALEPLEHRVQRRGQLLDLGRAALARRHTGGEVAGRGHLGGRHAEPAQRAQGDPAEGPSGRRRDRQRHQSQADDAAAQARHARLDRRQRSCHLERAADADRPEHGRQLQGQDPPGLAVHIGIREPDRRDHRQVCRALDVPPYPHHAPVLDQADHVAALYQRELHRVVDPDARRRQVERAARGG